MRWKRLDHEGTSREATGATSEEGSQPGLREVVGGIAEYMDPNRFWS